MTNVMATAVKRLIPAQASLEEWQKIIAVVGELSLVKMQTLLSLKMDVREKNHAEMRGGKIAAPLKTSHLLVM